MEIKTFIEDFDHCRKTSSWRTPFAEQLFAAHLDDWFYEIREIM